MLNKLLLPRGRRRRLCELMVVLNSRTRHCLGIVIHCSMQYTHYPCPDSTYVALLTFTLTVDHSQFIQHFNTVNKSECIKHVVFWMCIECLIMGCCLCTIINTLRICESTPTYTHTHTLSSPFVCCAVNVVLLNCLVSIESVHFGVLLSCTDRQVVA